MYPRVHGVCIDSDAFEVNTKRPLIGIQIHLYPGVGADYGWIKGKSVLTFVM